MKTKIKFIPEFETRGIVTGIVMEDTIFEILFCKAEKERAELIVKSVNMHEDLLRFAKIYYEYLKNKNENYSQSEIMHLSELIELLKEEV